MRSLSPRHFEAKVAEDTLKNVVPHSVATALANSVFPVPGGPNIRTPFHGLRMPWEEDESRAHQSFSTSEASKSGVGLLIRQRTWCMNVQFMSTVTSNQHLS